MFHRSSQDQIARNHSRAKSRSIAGLAAKLLLQNVPRILRGISSGPHVYRVRPTNSFPPIWILPCQMQRILKHAAMGFACAVSTKQSALRELLPETEEFHLLTVRGAYLGSAKPSRNLIVLDSAQARFYRLQQLHPVRTPHQLQTLHQLQVLGGVLGVRAVQVGRGLGGVWR